MPLIVDVEHSHTYSPGTTRTLNTHLASWGIAVAQTRQQSGFLSDGETDDERYWHREVLSRIPLIVEHINSMGSELGAAEGREVHHVSRVGVYGHGIGASVAAHALELDNVEAALGLSPLGIAESCDPSCGEGDGDALMLIVDADDFHGENSDTLAVAEDHDGPAWYFEFPEAGFNSFVDVCNPYYRNSGMGDAADALTERQLERELNGCTEDFRDPADVQAAVPAPGHDVLPARTRRRGHRHRHSRHTASTAHRRPGCNTRRIQTDRIPASRLSSTSPDTRGELPNQQH